MSIPSAGSSYIEITIITHPFAAQPNYNLPNPPDPLCRKRKTNPLPIHARQERRKGETTRLPDDTCTFFLLPLLSLISPKIKHIQAKSISLPICALTFRKAREHRRTTMKNKGVSSGPDRHLQCKEETVAPITNPRSTPKRKRNRGLSSAVAFKRGEELQIAPASTA